MLNNGTKIKTLSMLFENQLKLKKWCKKLTSS
jgi:hypothetical protein